MASWTSVIPFNENNFQKEMAENALQPHPLLMDHIVENVLLQMDPDLLGHYCKTFRLVCQDWERVATRIYKARRGRMTFKKNFIGKVSAMFIRVMHTSSNIPFEHFKFCPDSFEDEYFTEVLYVCSSAMRTLELSIVNPCTLTFPKMFPDLVLGNLRKLVFHVRIDVDGYGRPQVEMPSLLKTLFKISPKLQTVDLKLIRGSLRFPNGLEAFIAKVVENFGNVIAFHLPDGIRDLRLHLTLTEPQLQELCKRRLNLRSLDLYLQQSEVSSQVLEDFFRKCAPSLLFCKVLGNQFVRQRINFPVFTNLRVLSALGRAPKYLEYRKLFPRLQTLNICLWDSFDDIFPQNCFSPSLTTVSLPFQIDSPHIFHRMGKCFPAIKKLTGVTIGSADVLVAIFQSLRTLEVLDVTLGYDLQSSKMLDSCITGFNEMSQNPVSVLLVKQNEELIQEELRANGNTDSIRDLKELRRLSIITSPLTIASSVKITDLSVFYGFLQLKKLASITLDFFPISIQGLDALQKHARLQRPV